MYAAEGEKIVAFRNPVFPDDDEEWFEITAVDGR